MRFAAFAALAGCCAASAHDRPLVADSSQAPLFHNGDAPPAAGGFRIPTSRESAVMARRILALTPLGTLSTVFPASSQHFHHGAAAASADGTRGHADVAGVPIGMLDYLADCEPGGNPIILAINIATSFRNVRAGSNISLSLAWTPPHPPAKRISLWSFLGFGGAGKAAAATTTYSAANLPRFSLLGHLEKIDDAGADLAQCFVDTHPDAKYWLPGNSIHSAEWVRLVVTGVYWVGGFGDRAFIGWIPVDQWRSVSKSEWEAIRLPGEKKGWKEWSTAQLVETDL